MLTEARRGQLARVGRIVGPVGLFARVAFVDVRDTRKLDDAEKVRVEDASRRRAGE